MHVKSIDSVTVAEIRDLAIHAAERGERIEDANPFPKGTARRAAFSLVYTHRAHELRPFAVCAGSIVTTGNESTHA